MKHLLLAFVVIFLTLPTLAKGPSKEVWLGFIPGGDPKGLKIGADKLAKYLAQRTGIPFHVRIPKNYVGLKNAMKSGKVDFAFYTALSFVKAENEIPMKVLLKKVWSQNPFYYSTILVKKDSSIKNLKGLKGKKIAFVDKQSTSGYLLPLLGLKKNDVMGGNTKTSFTGNHKKSARLVLQGQVDGAAVFSDSKDGIQNAAAKFFPKEAKQLRPLWVSEPIPNDPFVVTKAFYDQHPRLTHEVMYSLVELSDLEGKQNILATYFGVEEMRFATSKQYEPIRKMNKSLRGAEK